MRGSVAFTAMKWRNDGCVDVRTDPAPRRPRTVGLSQSQLATKVGLSPAAISQFESGATRPSPETLDALCAALAMPVGFFSRPLGDTPRRFFQGAATHHRLLIVAGHVPSLMLRMISPPPRQLPAGFHQSTCRGFPSLLWIRRSRTSKTSRTVRSSWDLSRGPIENVVQLLESHGVVVTRLPLDSADVDAFSLPFPDHPVVVLGSDKADRARSRFDGTHELGHLVLHGEQIWGMKEVETQAHQFAAAFLMPANEIRDQLPNTVDWPRLFALKQQWQVSLAALLMRARTLGRMNERTYLTAVKTLSARGWRRREPVPLGAPEQPDLLMGFLSTAEGRQARSYLPGSVVDGIVIANDVA